LPVERSSALLWLMLRATSVVRRWFLFTISVARWVMDGLTRYPTATFGFWEVLVSGVVILVPAAVPPLSYLRDRR